MLGRILMVPAALSEEQVESALHELQVDAEELPELDGWLTHHALYGPRESSGRPWVISVTLAACCTLRAHHR